MTTVAGSLQTSDVLEKAKQYRNWGRWGADDELGAANFITPETIKAAATLVRTGKVFSLALPLDSEGPMTGAFGRNNPVHVMLQDGGDVISGAQNHLNTLRYTDDAIFMPLQCSTQWDALAHIYHDGQMYNGYGPEQVDSGGARKNSITNLKDRAIARGVLLDLPRYKNKRWLEEGEPISKEDLEGCAASVGVEVREGDMVLVRTGQLLERRELGTWGTFAGGPAPGLAISAADFFCPRNVTAVSTDTWGTEVIPNETAEVFQPLHIIMLVNAGMYLGEMWDMEELAADCAEDGVYEFMVVAAPLTVTGSVGSPVNPQAIK